MAENICIFIIIPRKFVPNGPIDNKPSLVQLMLAMSDKPLPRALIAQFTMELRLITITDLGQALSYRVSDEMDSHVSLGKIGWNQLKPPKTKLQTDEKCDRSVCSFFHSIAMSLLICRDNIASDTYSKGNHVLLYSNLSTNHLGSPRICETGFEACYFGTKKFRHGGIQNEFLSSLSSPLLSLNLYITQLTSFHCTPTLSLPLIITMSNH